MKFRHVTISVKDLEESLKFYRDLLNLPVNRRFSSGADSEIAFLGIGETEVELIYNGSKKDIAIGQDISIGFEVPSIEDMMTFLQQNGYSISDVWQPNPSTKFFFVNDPNGVRVQFIEHA
jgi:Lactoylglutathione lyase and related lyases